MSQARKRSAPQIQPSRPHLEIARPTSAPNSASSAKPSTPVSGRASAHVSVRASAHVSGRISGPTTVLHLQTLFQSTLESITALLPDSQGFIAILSANREFSLVSRTSLFSNVNEMSLISQYEPLHSLITGQAKELIVRSENVQTPTLDFQFSASGEVGLFRISLAGDLTAVLGIHIPDTKGGMTSERRKALQNQANLIEQAACSEDLKADVQVQQARMNRMREEIHEVQLFFRQFSEAVSQCFWVLDTQTPAVLLVSDNFEKVWGSSRECLNEGLSGFVSRVFPGDRDWVLSQFHLRFGEGLDIEFRVIDETGELRWIWLRSFASAESNFEASAQFDEANRSTGLSNNKTGARLSSAPDKAPKPKSSDSFDRSTRLVLIADDVTERKQAEEGLRDSEARLAARAKMTAVGELASGVAHEINNPLTVIVGRASELAMAAEKGTLDVKKVAETADKIRATSIRISKIVGSLKSLARKDLGKTVFHAYPLARVVHETSDLCAEKFKNQGVALEIPVIPDGVKLEMDPTLISQLILNLLNNAADAVEKENAKWVKVDFTEDKDSVYLFVTDSGPGIPLKIRSRIFDPFFTTKDPGRGTGLGLSLSSNIALHHHGMLQYDNLSSHTRFVLQLPKLNPNGVAAALKANANKSPIPSGKVG